MGKSPFTAGRWKTKVGVKDTLPGRFDCTSQDPSQMEPESCQFCNIQHDIWYNADQIDWSKLARI